MVDSNEQRETPGLKLPKAYRTVLCDGGFPLSMATTPAKKLCQNSKASAGNVRNEPKRHYVKPVL